MVVIMVHLCKMMIFLGIPAFHFFKILIFWVGRGVTGQEMIHNYKNVSAHSISLEPYII